MLKKIVIRNVNSINICEIDFTKSNYKFGDKNVLGDYVNPIVIYGHNGSGKSSALNAIAQFILLMSLPAEALNPFVVNNFLFDQYLKQPNKNANKVKGSIELTFCIDEDEYVYFLETSRHMNMGVSEEYLTKNGKDYFHRNGMEYIFKGEKGKVNQMSRVVPLLRLLASSEISDVTIQMVFAHISSYTHVNVSYINRGAFVSSKLFGNTNVFDLLADKSKEVREILKKYNDFPLYTIEKSNMVAANGLIAPQYNVVFEEGDFKGKLPIGMISTGMQNQSVLLSLLLSMPKDSVLFIDELDIALHPTAIKSFLDVIRERKIQVVMTLHNTYAMQSLRPDQIYFAKWSKGFSNYCRLSKIFPNIREVNNIEKMYLSSVFDEAINGNE